MCCQNLTVICGWQGAKFWQRIRVLYHVYKYYKDKMMLFRDEGGETHAEEEKCIGKRISEKIEQFNSFADDVEKKCGERLV